MDLQGYHLLLSGIPTVLGGEYAPKDLEHWLTERRRLELRREMGLAQEMDVSQEMDGLEEMME
jgi:hypothetical protein